MSYLLGRYSWSSTSGCSGDKEGPNKLSYLYTDTGAVYSGHWSRDNTRGQRLALLM